MMKICIALGAVAVMSVSGSPAFANFDGCSVSEKEAIMGAISGARVASDKASSRVGDNDHYKRWFGAYDKARADRVKSNLDKIESHLLIGQITASCHVSDCGDNGSDSFAGAYYENPYEIYFCTGFFEQRSLSEPIQPPLDDKFGTKEGTVIHEMSHFDITAGTDDACDRRSTCEQLAIDDPDEAIKTADSYLFFVEDSSIFLPF